MLPTILLQSRGAGALVIGLLFFLLYLGMVVWTYRDAKRNSSHPAFLWAVVVFLAPLLGIVLYLILGRGS
ncbi:PLDc N-terminal domain-containing protein [Haloferax sp. KTX1]|uniref:PLDc N-terminal domain-containing protein n=1 Tax=Haloferax sp. KTX1 TaxID=2600597 RepID=UPI0011DC7FC0|nr:PLDc N-terminal domain-containing protein [Haloferax sp. KTX1]